MKLRLSQAQSKKLVKELSLVFTRLSPVSLDPGGVEKKIHINQISFITGSRSLNEQD